MEKSLRLKIFFQKICNQLVISSIKHNQNSTKNGMTNPILNPIKYTKVENNPHNARDQLSPMKILAGLILNHKKANKHPNTIPITVVAIY